MGTDGTDFHGFESVLICEIRVYPCPDFKLSGSQGEIFTTRLQRTQRFILASCILHPCILHPASCILHLASLYPCILTRRSR